ncbi:MAG TPA: GntR family transcriptional regulator [Solirubrobacteraceae bacterium]|nr:GntR family transcriptional regulator [Solirubrobacteraceae bacterium]
MTENGSTRTGDIVVQVHAQLREAILSGDVRPGEKTSQAELARELGVGRTPLREAVRMLQHEGLVLAEPNRRVEIARLSIDDVEQLYIARISLETAAARVTVPHLTAGDIAELEGFMAQMAHIAASGPEGLPLFKAPHRAFHERFVDGVGPRLTTLIGELFDHSERYRRIYGAASPTGFAQRDLEHRAMLDAAAAADLDGIAEAIAVHYVNTALLVARALDTDSRLPRLQAAVIGTVPGAMRAFG